MAIIEKIQVGGSTYDIGVQGPNISGQIPVETLPSIPATKLSGTISTNNLPTIPANKLPSYVDDVIEGYYSGGKFYSDDKKANLIIGEKGKIYVDITTTKGLSYRCTTNDSNTQTYISINGSNNISKNVVANTASSNANAAAANGSVYLNHLEESSVTSSHKISGSGATTVTADANGNIIINSKDTNTHYESKNVVTNSSTSKVNTTAAITTNGSVWLNHIENDTVKSYHNIKGDGATTVTTDASGNIIIKSTDTNSDTKVTNTLNTAAKGYITATTTSTTNTGTQIFDTGVYLGAAAGSLYATTFVGNLSGTATNATNATTATKLSTTGHNLVGGGITTVTASGSNIVINTNNPHIVGKNVVGLTASSIANTTTAIASNGYVYLNHIENNSVKSSHNIKGDGATTVTADASGNIIIKSTDNNTHYTSKNVVANASNATANAAATNGNVYLNHLEESTVKSYHKISGSGATTVTADASGNIIISSTDTNTDRSVTSAAYHYTPASDTNSTITKNASSSTAATWDTTGLVTGMTVSRDSRGHVTDVTLSSVKMPAKPVTKNIVGLTASSTTNTSADITTNGIYLNHTVDGALKSSHKISGSNGTTVTADASGNIIITGSHYTSKNIVANTASATANAAAGNGIYLNHIENGAIRSSHKISGSGITTVKADANGNITVNTPVSYNSGTKTLVLG